MDERFRSSGFCNFLKAISMNARQHLKDIAMTLGLKTLDFDANGCARLLFDGKVAVNFESDEVFGQLHLYSDLGELPLRGREAVYRALLEGNLFGIQTQGATLALDGSQDQVMLSRTLLMEELSLSSFSQMLEGFVGCAEYWQNVLAEGSVGAASAAGSGRLEEGRRTGGDPFLMQV